MNTRIMKSLLAAAALTVALAAPTAGAVPISAISLGGETAFGTATGTVGWRFTTASAITVTDLGYFDRGGDGLVSTHEVGMWTIGGALLATATVSTTDVLDGAFRFADVADFTIAAGDYIVAGVNSSADGYIAASSFVTAAGITFVEGRFALGSSSLAFPGSVDSTGAGSVFGGSFRFATAVPEPLTMLLVAFGLLGSGFARRLRR